MPTVTRNEAGIVTGAEIENVGFVPKAESNRHWRRFVASNAAQTPPLDLSDLPTTPPTEAQRRREAFDRLVENDANRAILKTIGQYINQLRTNPTQVFPALTAAAVLADVRNNYTA